MNYPTIEAVKAYYDERIEGKIRDFTDFNPRIEGAIQTLAEWAPVYPKRVLEIGCGIGATSWRMARAWPHAEVIGADVSPASIDVANMCFRLGNLKFHAGILKEGTLDGKFDLVVLMDVYEHIAPVDRPPLHAAIISLLAEDARVFLSFPTPAVQNHARIHSPSDLQPVDENITPADLMAFADEIGSRILYYREVGIWRYGDYVHAVLGRYRTFETVALRQPKLRGLPALKKHTKRMLTGKPTSCVRYRDYLGSDMLRPSPRDIAARFNVTARKRRNLISSWLQRNSD